MKKTVTLCALFFKARLISRSFIALSAVVLILTAGFSLLCPSPAPSSAIVGIIYDSSDAELSKNCQQLLELEEVTFIRYIEEEQMRQDVIAGKLHCGYRINISDKPAVTVFETESSLLTPALDELVFSCRFESEMVKNAAELYKNGKYRELIDQTIARSRLENKPFSVNISVKANASGGEYQSYSLLPIVYAVIIPLVLLSSCFCAMLAPDHELNAYSLLLKSGSKKLVFISRLLAHFMLFLLLFIICESVISALITQNSFSIAARLIAAAATAFSGAVLFELFGRIKANSAVLLLLILWTVFSVIFSGAFISPELFGGLAPLKYISPSWLLLRLMTAVTAL